jgi:hypothetical protein
VAHDHGAELVANVVDVDRHGFALIPAAMHSRMRAADDALLYRVRGLVAGFVALRSLRANCAKKPGFRLCFALALRSVSFRLSVRARFITAAD